MRIALALPTYWPEVRRGTERLVHDLSVALVARGHDVTILTTHPGRTTVSDEEGVRVIRDRRLPDLRRLRFYEDHVATIPSFLARLAQGRFDLVHAFFPPQAWAAIRAKRFGGPPVVFSYHGIPGRAYLVKRRYRLEMLKQAFEDADVASVLSRVAADEARRLLQVDPVVLPGGVFASEFSAGSGRTEAPSVICAASLWDRRKRADVLFEAWEQVADRMGEATLRVVRPRDLLSVPGAGMPPGAEYSTERIELADGGELELPRQAVWVDADATAQLARAYASSWVSVLPAVNEAFGLVLIESLAAGTPVVAARSGACQEIITDERVGRLFEPDDPGALTQSLLDAFELAKDPGVTGACRARAEEFDWARVVRTYEASYQAAVG